MTNTRSRQEQLALLETMQAFVDAVADVFVGGRQPTNDERLTLVKAINRLQRTLQTERERIMGAPPSDRSH